MWLAGAIPDAYGSLIFSAIPTFFLFCETHNLVCEIISVSERRMKNCIVKCVRVKNGEGFVLIHGGRDGTTQQKRPFVTSVMERTSVHTITHRGISTFQSFSKALPRATIARPPAHTYSGYFRYLRCISVHILCTVCLLYMWPWHHVALRSRSVCAKWTRPRKGRSDQGS